MTLWKDILSLFFIIWEIINDQTLKLFLYVAINILNGDTLFNFDMTSVYKIFNNLIIVTFDTFNYKCANIGKSTNLD